VSGTPCMFISTHADKQNVDILVTVCLSFSFSSCGATMEAVAGMLLHSTALRPVSCTGPMRIPGVCV